MFRPQDLVGVRPLIERPAPAEPVIYFISAKAPDFPIKIGQSNTYSLQRRLSQLQTPLPYMLEVLYVTEAPLGTEASLHLELGRSWMRGEWFSRSEAVMQHLAKRIEQDPDWRERFDLCAFRGR